MRQNFNPKFLRRYEIGVKLYLEGFWPEAKLILEDVIRIKCCDDKPTNLLLKFMSKFNYTVPDDWMGFRSLEAK